MFCKVTSETRYHYANAAILGFEVKLYISQRRIDVNSFFSELSSPIHGISVQFAVLKG